MVNIAIAGGSGQVAREVIDALLASRKHEITILSRKACSDVALSILNWKIVDYNDTAALAEALNGTHTLLSFVQLLSDPGQQSQKNLIDAAIAAGVKRFAPSEYGSKETTDMPWWHGKGEVRNYLRKVNAENDVLEYTLFQPGLFLDYLAYPHKTSKYVDPLQTVFNFEQRRAMIVRGYENAVLTLTTVGDLATLIAKAVEHEGKWPEIAGIRGNRLTFSQILDIGERVRGAPFAVDELEITDIEAGNLFSSWGLEAVHQAVPDDQASALLKTVSIGILLSSAKGAWDSSDEMNQCFPDHDFTMAEDFLRDIWSGQA